MFVKLATMLAVIFSVMYLGGQIDLSYIENDAKGYFESDKKSRWQEILSALKSFVGSDDYSDKVEIHGGDGVNNNHSENGDADPVSGLVSPNHPKDI